MSRLADVLSRHRLTFWSVYPWGGGHEVAPRCTCGVLWSAGERDDLEAQTVRWESHLAVVILDLLGSDEARDVVARHIMAASQCAVPWGELSEVAQNMWRADAANTLDALADWLGGDA